MTDQFTDQLRHLIHVAQERIDLVDSATAHADAIAERYQALHGALDRADACQQQLRARLLELLAPVPEAPRIHGLAEVLEMDRRRA